MNLSLLKKPLFSAVAIFGTLGMLSVGYAAYSTYSNLKPGTPFSIKSWNAVVNNLGNHEERIASLSSQMASIVSERKSWTAIAKTPEPAAKTETPAPSTQLYRTACSYSSYSRYVNCCRVSVTSWAVICKYSYNISYDWNKFEFDPFQASINSDYSVSIMNEDNKDFVVCRTDNSTGAVECVYSIAMSRPWIKFPYNPF